MKSSLHHIAPNNPMWPHSQWWCGSEGWVQLGYKKDGCLGILSGSNSNRQLHHHHQHGIEILSRNRRNNNSVGIVLSWVDQCWNIFWQLQTVDKYVDYCSMNVANILINVTNILMAVWLIWLGVIFDWKVRDGRLGPAWEIPALVSDVIDRSPLRTKRHKLDRKINVEFCISFGNPA